MHEYVTLEQAAEAFSYQTAYSFADYMDMLIKMVAEGKICPITDTVKEQITTPISKDSVIRCKDCKWYADNSNCGWFGCHLYYAIKAIPEDAPGPDDFCSYAEAMGPDD